MNQEQATNYLNQSGHVFWMTGLSGSGKSTIAYQTSRLLTDKGYFHKILDGDEIRNGLCTGLGFSPEDRMENIRRVAEVASILRKLGVVVICSLITPTQASRDLASNIIGKDHYTLVHINTPLDVCQKRDVKGLYKKAVDGEIPMFTGISAPFDTPVEGMTLDTTRHDQYKLAQMLLNHIIAKQ